MKQIQKNLAQTKEAVMQQHNQTALSSWEGEEARKLEQAERDGRYNSSTHLQVDRQTGETTRQYHSNFNFRYEQLDLQKDVFNTSLCKAIY